ncbi:hypothetical protein [Acidiplasma sp.]|uniref:hypothetical protein n=1 Tax=Acidiplasma sp. TaxID=1872114 RepID=UPI002589ED39|nr:hypothetical protein [Acidiplasma sp.]
MMVRCYVCRTPLCQFKESEHWYCPKCRKWLILEAYRHKHYSGVEKKACFGTGDN